MCRQMDLTAGYHQAPLYTPHRIYTEFLCFMGLFQFTRLPFGPCRAPFLLSGADGHNGPLRS